jgi:hydrogenase nickel incorporation protein HypA/HybF
MHELSIAMSIVETCTEEAEKAGGSMVSSVELEIGTLSGVIPEALEFSWDVAIKDTPLEKAKLVINLIQASVRCLDCGNEFVLHDPFSPCPSCGGFARDILQGQELKIRALTVE